MSSTPNAAQPGAGPPAPRPGSAATVPVAPRRRRRRKIVLALLILIALLVVIVGVSPYVLSTNAGKDYALSLVNGRIRGALQLDALSLSWLGPTRLRGLRVLDADKQEVLNVGEVNTARGVWGLILGAANFGELRIESPRAILAFGRDNTISLADAFQPRQPAAATSPGPLPEPRGRIVVQGGSVRTLREHVEPYEVTNIGGEIELQTLGQVKGKLTASLPGSATLAADADFRDLVTKGELRPAGATGKLTFATDRPCPLGPLLRVVSPTHPMDGSLSVKLQAAAAGGELTVNAQGDIQDLAVQTGEQSVREKRVSFELDAAVNDSKQILSLSHARLTSATLTAEVGGTVSDLSGACVLALQGRYDAAWAPLTALLHEFVPATASTVIVEGNSTSTFEVTGPLRTAGAKPSYRGVKAGVDVGWSSARLYGVAVGATKISPALHDAQLTIPTTRIPAAEGNVNLAGLIDLQSADPTLHIGEPLQLLDGVALTPELAASVLSWINPLFENVTQIEGRISLKASGVDLPLSAVILKRGQATGQLDLEQVRLAPAGFARTLAELTGLPTEKLIPVQFGQLDFVIRDGRVRYDNFAVNFPAEVDLKFYGSVGLDGTLDLIVSVPVRAGLLQQLGVSGGPLAFAQQLSGLRVEIPLIGTRAQPQLNLAAIDKEKLLKQLLGAEAPGKQLEGLLRGLGGDSQKDKPGD